MSIFKPKPKKKTVRKKQPPKQQKTFSPPVMLQAPKIEPRPFIPYSYTPPNLVEEALSVDKVREDTKKLTAKFNFNPEKEFLTTFKKLTYRHRGWDIWNDFVIMAACALSNPVDKTHYDEREARYLRIINKYDKQEQQLFPILFAHTVMALELNPEQDFLGKLYTQLGLQDDGRRQHFTPYSVCQLMADITMDDISEQVQQHGFVTLNDPCCGAGATLIAGIHTAKRHLQKIDLNFQNHLLVAAQDIDETVALMCYIQLSLLGVAAYIKIGNTITDPMTPADTLENYWFTPMYFSDVWAMRRLVHRMDELIQTGIPKLEKKPFKLLIKITEEECRCSLVTFYTTVAKKAGLDLTDNSRFDCTKICCTKAVQDAIFQYYQWQGGNAGEIVMLWADSGPKANLSESGYAVEIEDGFVTKGEV